MNQTLEMHSSVALEASDTKAVPFSPLSAPGHYNAQQQGTFHLKFTAKKRVSPRGQEDPKLERRV